MSKSYISNIAEMLGVELGEEFEIDSLDGVYKFNNFYLMNLDNRGVWKSDSEALSLILNGNCEIIKKPWIPHNNEIYYFINLNGTIECSIFWNNSHIDRLNVKMGNFFKTRDKAIAYIPKWKEYINNESNFLWR